MDFSVIGILISLAFLMVLALRGFHIIVLAPIAVIIVSLLSGLNPFQSLIGPYMKGFVNFAGKFYLIFLAGSMFGKFMEDSGAARSISEGIIKVIGADSQVKAMWAIAFITSVLTYAGVALFVVMFSVIPIARPIWKRLNIPWHLYIAAQGLGLGAITMTMLPGTPSVLNILPTKYLGTTATAGATIGIASAVIVVLFNVWYFKDQLRRANLKGEGYEVPTDSMISMDDNIPKRGLPNVWLCLVPPALVIALLNVFKLDVVIALGGGIVACAILFWNYYENKLQTLNKGALNTVVPIINTSADVGYGMAVAATAGFGIITGWLLSIPGHPTVSLSIATNLMAAITGSASGGLGIIMETLIPQYLALGVNPELVHRIAAISAGCFDTMPHNGAVITTLAVCGLTHKLAYKHFWWGHMVATAIALVIVIPLGLIIYK